MIFKSETLVEGFEKVNVGFIIDMIRVNQVLFYYSMRI